MSCLIIKYIYTPGFIPSPECVCCSLCEPDRPRPVASGYSRRDLSPVRYICRVLVSFFGTIVKRVGDCLINIAYFV